MNGLSFNALGSPVDSAYMTANAVDWSQSYLAISDSQVLCSCTISTTSGSTVTATVSFGSGRVSIACVSTVGVVELLMCTEVVLGKRAVNISAVTSKNALISPRLSVNTYLTHLTG